MGIKYLTSYADSLLGDPAGIVRDIRIPPFSAAAAAPSSSSSSSSSSPTNVIVLDASGGLARYLKPDDDAERNLFDYQEMFLRVASDVAALRALGYEPVAFLDAAVPTSKLPVWKSRRRQEFGKLLKLARCVDSGAPWPKDAWTPPESGLQALADAFASAGCEVHLGVEDVDREAAAFCKSSRAYAVLTCDSDFFAADLGAATVRLWHWEHLGLSRPKRQRRLSSFAASASSSSSSRAPPALRVREYRVDLLRARLRLDGPGGGGMPLLAALLGNDGVPHITKAQLARVLAERPPGFRAATAAGGGGGRGGRGDGRWGGGGRGRGGGGGSGPPPARVVEVLAHELARQLQQPSGSGGSAALVSDAARHVASRLASYARAAREAYESPASDERPHGSFTPAGAGRAPNVVRAVLQSAGVMVKAQRSDDVREPAVTACVRELRMRVYAGCGVMRVRELLYNPIPAAAAAAKVGAAAAAAGAAAAAAGAAAPPSVVPPPTTFGGPLGETRSLLEALPNLGGDDVSEARTVWQEEFVDVDVAAELAALGRAAAAAAAGGNGDGKPLLPLLPTSPEVVAAAKSGEALASFAARELLRLELITPVEAELIKRQASPTERAEVRRQAEGGGRGWSGTGVIACMRSVRVATLLITVHTWLAVLLDNKSPTIESLLDVRVFNELWRREVARLEKEEQPRGAALRRRWVREGGAVAAAAAEARTRAAVVVSAARAGL